MQISVIKIDLKMFRHLVRAPIRVLVQVHVWISGLMIIK
jgi:hypothetical protein